MNWTYSDYAKAVIATYNLVQIKDREFCLYQRGKNFLLFIFAEHITIYSLSDPEAVNSRKREGRTPAHRIILKACRKNRRRDIHNIMAELDGYPRVLIEYCDPQMFDIIDRLIASTKGPS